MKTPTIRSTAQGRPAKRLRVLRCVLFALLLMLLMMATGCDDIFADMLSGEGCGTHDVCTTKAATAGIAATLMGLAGTYIQKQEDAPTAPWPWDKDQSDFDAELDAELDEADIAGVKPLEEGPAGGGDEVTGGTEETIEDILGPDTHPESDTVDTKPSGETQDQGAVDDGTAPWDKEGQSADTGQDDEAGSTRPDTAPIDESELEEYGLDGLMDDDKGADGAVKTPTGGGKEPEAESAGDSGDKAEGAEGGEGGTGDKDKPASPAAPYVPLTTIGNVTILEDPDTGRIAVQGGSYVGGKDQDGYWITDDNKIVRYDPDTGKYTVSDGHFTASHEGTTYTVTKDNTVLIYDHVNEGLTIRDGSFIAVREGTMYAVTDDNKVLAFDQATGEFVVSDGHFTASHDGTTYAVTNDNKILSYDEATGNVKVSDGHFTATREGTTYAVTDDNKILTYDESTGNVKVSDGHFTATREGTIYTVTKDDKILTYNEASGDFTVSDGHYVLDREGSVTAFTKDNVKIQYDQDTHGVLVTAGGPGGELAVGADGSGQWGAEGTIKGSMDGTPTTFGLSATRYNLPETGEQGFAGGVSLEQEDFELHAGYIQDSGERAFGVEVRKDDWTVGFQRSETFGPQATGDTKSYNLGWRDVKLGFEEGQGGTLSTAGFTHRF